MRSAARLLALLPMAAVAALAVAVVSGREPATSPAAPSTHSKPAGRVEIVRNREITELAYSSSDGRKIPAVLSMPRGNGPFPVVVTIHGGQGNRDLAFIRTLAVPGGVSSTVTMLNEQPWAILAISYRAGGGALLGIEQDDVVAGIHFAKTLPRVDPARVGVLGGSHGGHLALRAAEVMGREMLCVAAGSPWMTNPRVYLFGEPDKPPLSEISAQARTVVLTTRATILPGLQRNRGLSAEALDTLLAERSIEEHAAQIIVPALFLTSLADEQVPHAMVEPTIARLKAAGRDVAVYTATKSLHGFYWGRDVGRARVGRGSKTPDELAEEAAARDQILRFFTRWFATEGSVPAAERAGLSGIRKVRAGGLEREYLVHVPPARPGDEALPVVLVFHGGGGNAEGTARLTGFNGVADRERFIVVYPQGIGGSWNDGRQTRVTQAHRDKVDDLAFFDALLAALSTERRIDPKRVFATGISNGGIFSHFLAARRSERIAAIAPVVGGIADPFHLQFHPARPVSVLIIQGTEDPLVPYAGGPVAGGGGGRDRGRVIATDEAVKLWVRHNGCAAEPTTRPTPDRDPRDGCVTTSFAWTRCREGTEVQLYRVDGGGHAWPSGAQYLPQSVIGRVTRDFGTDAIWRFFKEHAKP